MGVSGQRHAPAALYPWGKNPRYPLNRRLGGPQSRSGRRGQKKNLPLSGIEPRTSIARSSSPQSDTAWATAAPGADGQSWQLNTEIRFVSSLDASTNSEAYKTLLIFFRLHGVEDL
jgi:hypothetical protein